MTTQTSAPAGWYPDPSGVPGQRYFDGTNWTEHTVRELTPQERVARLDAAIELEVSRGARLESRLTDYSAVLVFGSNVNHVAHLLGVMLTCGLWLIGWVIAASCQYERRRVLHVDPYGQVTNTSV